MAYDAPWNAALMVIAGEEIGARDSCEGHDFPFLAIVKFDKTSTFRLMADAIQSLGAT
jgi:hypothetical protein